MKLPTIFACAAALAIYGSCGSVNNAKTHPDEVLRLPGLDYEPNFRQYSGYLRGSDTSRLHYWFVESQSSPKTDPVLLWLNGGPGCSSLEGMLDELGPFRVNPDGRTLDKNEYTWNKIANIIFLESPAGVGFSYSTDGNITTDDDLVGLQNYNALKDFFTNKFPEYRKNDFYITGESYAGVYIPVLAILILDGLSDFTLNFKGLAIGNGIVDYRSNFNTGGLFAYWYGLIDERSYRKLESSCCNGCFDDCDVNSMVHGKCRRLVKQFYEQMWNKDLQVYDIYRDCIHIGKKSQRLYRRDLFDMSSEFPVLWDARLDIEDAEFEQAASTKRKTKVKHVACFNMTPIHVYLDQKLVHKALHIPDSAPVWLICKDKSYKKLYRRIYKDMTKHYRKLLDNYNIRILLYYGDTDLVVNFIMGQRFVASLNQPMKQNTTVWRYKNQIAGSATLYDKIDFLTVKGCGHMVPLWKPAQALKMITSFINNQPY